MRYLKNIHFSIFGLSLILFSFSAYAKKRTQYELSRDWMYKKSNVYLTAHPTFSPKPKITSFSNPYHLGYSMSGGSGFNFGFVYMYNFSKNYGLSVGVNLALLSFRTFKYKFSIPPDIQNIVEDTVLNSANFFETGKEFVNHTTNFPIRFIYRKEVTPKIDLNLQIGFDIELQRSFIYLVGSSVQTYDSGLVNYFYLSFENNGNWTRSFTPYFACSFGINQLLKNNHYINYQFSAHIPFVNPYTNGHFYVLPGTPFEAKGTFKLMPYTFGLEVNYIFTFNRRKLRKNKQTIP